MRLLQMPYLGSFQRGKIIRSDNPLECVWRRIERLGTVDNLHRIAEEKKVDPAIADLASIRIRQSIELRSSASKVSMITRPLMLYYSLLNLVRGILLVFKGDYGPRSHGLAFVSRENLLECGAKTKEGTFREFSLALGTPSTEIDGKEFLLKDLLGLVPEIWDEYPLLAAGPGSLALVEIGGYRDASLKLRFLVRNVSEMEFSSNWEDLFPWFKDDCELDREQPFTLKTKNNYQDEAQVAKYCRKKLIPDLRFRDDAIWYDQVTSRDVTLMDRLFAYFAALFILSNVCRYQPELLEKDNREYNDKRYVIATFLDCTERFFPQLILERSTGLISFFE